MNKSILVFVLVSCFMFACQASWTEQHEFSIASSQAISASIKAFLLPKLATNTEQWAKSLTNDLNNADNSKRTLKQLTVAEASKLLALFNLKLDASCDQNSDGVLKGGQLKCLNLIWKSWVPLD